MNKNKSDKWFSKKEDCFFHAVSLSRAKKLDFDIPIYSPSYETIGRESYIREYYEKLDLYKKILEKIIKPEYLSSSFIAGKDLFKLIIYYSERKFYYLKVNVLLKTYMYHTKAILRKTTT